MFLATICLRDTNKFDNEMRWKNNGVSCDFQMFTFDDYVMEGISH